MVLRRRDVFPEITPLREAMDRLFEQSFLRSSPMSGLMAASRFLPVDMYVTDNDVVIKAAVPGLSPEDMDIKIVGDTVTISGERQAERNVEEEDYVVREMSIGRVHREIVSPVALKPDQAQATFDNGVLTISIPKAEQAKTKQIKIQVKNQGP